MKRLLLPAVAFGTALAFTIQALAPAAAAQAARPAGAVPLPAALTADGMPPVPLALTESTRPYMEFRSAGFRGWHPERRSMLIATRFGNADQLHEVAAPGAARVQLSFEPERVSQGVFLPDGATTLAIKDVGGDENFQIFRLESGRLALLTDGRSRNTGATWTRDGRLVGFSSNARNGRDTDLWVVNPRDPATRRLVAEREGGGWSFADFHPDGRSAVVRRYISIERSELHRLDLATGRVTPLTRDRRAVAYGRVRHAADGRLFATSDEGRDFQQLGVIDARGAFRRIGPESRFDVEDFDLLPDGRIVTVTNEAGASRLRILDGRTGAVLLEPELPAGVISGLEVAPWGPIGFTLSSARSPGDAWSVDPATGAVTRWTMSETGGLDPAANVEPELIRVASFDGLEVTGFLYRPDPARFPGPRPLIVSIHGGPEAQSRPGFLGRNNYLLNERGIAIFYPNVRGSSGFGRTFVSLDNGPFQRENSVRDIAAFVDALARDPGLDSSRFGVTGGSYGGYMTYAALTLFPDRWRAGLSVVGISDFVTFLENTADYRRDLRRVEYGDERDPRQRAKLREISPLGRADRITVPLMVVTGANDPRVPASEADQMVEAVRRNGRTAWHLVAANEGHGFARKENQDYQFWSSLMFWEQTLLAPERAGP